MQSKHKLEFRFDWNATTLNRCILSWIKNIANIERIIVRWNGMGRNSYTQKNEIVKWGLIYTMVKKTILNRDEVNLTIDIKKMYNKETHAKIISNMLKVSLCVLTTNEMSYASSLTRRNTINILIKKSHGIMADDWRIRRLKIQFECTEIKSTTTPTLNYYCNGIKKLLPLNPCNWNGKKKTYHNH